jgi:hypothetical protein
MTPLATNSHKSLRAWQTPATVVPDKHKDQIQARMARFLPHVEVSASIRKVWFDANCGRSLDMSFAIAAINFPNVHIFPSDNPPMVPAIVD